MAKKIALCIGINDYPGTDSDLRGCVNDVSDWSAALQARGFHCAQLIDSSANGKAMRKAITDTVSSAATGDTVVIQYSGHGSFVADDNGDEDDGTDECICPHDIVENGPITDDELNELFAARATNVKVVFVADSCHSGTVAKFAPISTPPTIAGIAPPIRKVRFLPPASFLSARSVNQLGSRSRRSASPPGRHESLLLSGCQDVEYSYDAWFENRPNGAFTFVALRELRALPQVATYRQWHKAIRKALPSQQYAQTPQLYGTATQKNWVVFA